MPCYKLQDVISSEYERACRIRLRETLKRFDGEHPILDIGERNVLGEIIKADSYTTWDLNEPWPTHCATHFKTITCFEVLEHLVEAKLCLKEIAQHLETEGRLYLTTPVRWWMGKGEYHFKEYNRNELVTLLTECGLRIQYLTRIRAYTWKWAYFGVRPIIRWIRDICFGQCLFVIASKFAKLD